MEIVKEEGIEMEMEVEQFLGEVKSESSQLDSVGM
jgi:hypothetical protein